LTLMFLFPFRGNCQSQAALAVCEAIITNAAHNVYLNTSSYEFYDSVYDHYCKYDGSQKNQHLDTGAKIVYEGVPMAGMESAGNNEVNVQEFCRAYSSSRHQRSTTYGQNTLVVEKALETTKDCVHFALSTNSIEHEFGVPSLVTLTITVGGGSFVDVSSLGHSPNVVCVGPGKQSNITYGIGTKYHIDANAGTYSIECTRASTATSDGGRFYENASLALTTSAGSYHVFWPQKTEEPERIAEKIAGELNTLRHQVNTLQSELAALGSDKNNQSIHTFAQGTPGQFHSCPAGQFVSGIGPQWSKENHLDSAMANIQVECRKAVVENPDKQ